MPYAGIILAAGRSSRMGIQKAELRLQSLGGTRALDALVGAFAAVKIAPIAVVGADAAGTIRVEGDPAQPMIDSIARAIAALPDDVEGVLVQPVDAPYTTPNLLLALTRGPAPARARVPYYAGDPGHPVLIARALFSAIEGRPEGGLKALLALGDVERLEVDDARILADLDTPADIREWEP